MQSSRAPSALPTLTHYPGPRTRLTDSRLSANRCRHHRKVQVNFDRFDVFVIFYTLHCFSLKTVQLMRLGFSPSEAASQVFDEMRQFYPNVEGGVVAVSKNGTHGL